MCIADKALGRRTIIRQRTLAEAGGAVTVLPSDPRRLVLIVTSRFQTMVVGTNPSNPIDTAIAIFPTGSVAYNPPMRVEEYGLALMGELGIVDSGGSPYNATVTEILADYHADLAIQQEV